MKVLILLAITCLSLSANASPKPAPFDFSGLTGNYAGDCKIHEDISQGPIDLVEKGIELTISTTEYELRGRVTKHGNIDSYYPRLDGIGFYRVNSSKEVDKDCKGGFIGHTSIREYESFTIEGGLFSKFTKRSCVFRRKLDFSNATLVQTASGFDYSIEGKYRQIQCTFARK